MTVYVDTSRNPFDRMIMSHMMADSLEELHLLAAQLDLSPRWFQDGRFQHYDICQAKRAEALKLGAVEVSPREMVRLAQAQR